MGLESTLYNVGYPVYGARFLNNSTLLVTGGGGEGNNGIPNKLTALQVNFQKKKIVKRFRELTLDDNEDSPTTLDVAQDVILMGCNENSEKIRSGGPNHHLRKFVYENEHLKFVGAIDLNRSTDPEDYTKLLYMSQDGSVAAIASSVVPTVIRIVNPSNLRETYEVETGNDVKDLHFSSDGKVLAYITSSTLEVISIVTGNFIVRKTDFEKNLSLSKIRFVGENTILIAASLKKDAGIVLTKISLKKGNTSILKTKLVTKKFKSVTSMDVDPKGQLVALAGSDNSVAIVKLKSFTVGKFFKQIHTFAVTRVAFSPDSRLLVSASAANTIHLVQIPDDFATKTSMLEKLCKFLINFVLVALLALLVQISFKHGLPSKTYNIIRKHIISKDNKTPNSLFNDIFLPQTTLVGDVVTVLPSTKSLNTESASFPTDQWVNEAGSHVVDNSYPTSELKEGIVEKYYSGITELDLSMPRSEDLTKEAGQDSLVTDDSTDDKGYEHILSEDNVISRDESVLSGDTFETATSSVHEERSSVQKASIPSYIDSTSQFSGIVDNEKASYSSPGNIVEKIYVLDTEEGTTISESSDASLNDASTGYLEEYLYDPINDIFETSPCSSVNYDASGVDVPNEQTSELSIERHSSSTGISSSKSNILDHPRIGPLQSAISALVNNVGPRKKDESSKSHSITEESNPTGLDDKTENFRSKSSSGLLQDMEDEIIHPRSVLNSFRSLNMKLNEKTSLESSRTLSTTKPSARTSSKSYSKVYSEVDPETDKKSSPAAEEPSISTGLPDLMVTMPTSALVSTNTKDTEVEDSRLIMSESLDTIDCDSSNCPTSSFDKTAERQESSINSDKSTAGFGKEINVSTYTAPPIYRTMSDSDKKNIASPSAASQSSGSNVEIVTVKEIVKETVFVTEKLVETTAPGNKHDEL